MRPDKGCSAANDSAANDDKTYSRGVSQGLRVTSFEGSSDSELEPVAATPSRYKQPQRWSASSAGTAPTASSSTPAVLFTKRPSFRTSKHNHSVAVLDNPPCPVSPTGPLEVQHAPLPGGCEDTSAGDGGEDGEGEGEEDSTGERRRGTGKGRGRGAVVGPHRSCGRHMATAQLPPRRRPAASAAASLSWVSPPHSRRPAGTNTAHTEPPEYISSPPFPSSSSSSSCSSSDRKRPSLSHMQPVHTSAGGDSPPTLCPQAPYTSLPDTPLHPLSPPLPCSRSRSSSPEQVRPVYPHGIDPGRELTEEEKVLAVAEAAAEALGKKSTGAYLGSEGTAAAGEAPIAVCVPPCTRGVPVTSKKAALGFFNTAYMFVAVCCAVMALTAEWATVWCLSEPSAATPAFYARDNVRIPVTLYDLYSNPQNITSFIAHAREGHELSHLSTKAGLMGVALIATGTFAFFLLIVCIAAYQDIGGGCVETLCTWGVLALAPTSCGSLSMAGILGSELEEVAAGSMHGDGCHVGVSAFGIFCSYGPSVVTLLAITTHIVVHCCSRAGHLPHASFPPHDTIAIATAAATAAAAGGASDHVGCFESDVYGDLGAAWSPKYLSLLGAAGGDQQRPNALPCRSVYAPPYLNPGDPISDFCQPGSEVATAVDSGSEA